MNSELRASQDMDTDRQWFEDDLLNRFLSYVRVNTTSDRHATCRPSTPGQWDLARQLLAELQDMGVQDAELDDKCFLIARIPGTAEGTPIGFMAHLDTAPDLTGEDVKPQVHANYDGGVISLGDNYSLDPADYPALLAYKGQTVITTDGTTLLGADDKAGIAEIMTAVRYLLDHPHIPHPQLEVVFTPDEETGQGMDDFPVDRLQSTYCYTLDGSDEGAVEAECFSAFGAKVTFSGSSIHPGTARGKLVNAVTMAAQFASLLPRSESPEATDGTFGFYAPTEISGGIESATLSIIVRDFNLEIAKRRVNHLDSIAKVVEGGFPGGKVTVEVKQQYLNMAEGLRDHPAVTLNALQAIRMTGQEPTSHLIRGGTDGARLSEMGVPTPNIFTGGQNYHGRYEWVALPAMVRAARTVINLAQLFVTDSQST